MSRNTIQKEAVKEYLMSVTSHPTADTVYMAVREKLPSISKGTVYRILKSFTEDGQIQEISSEVSHYDGNSSQHAHFICKKCGNVIDIFDNNSKIRYNEINEFGKIETTQLNFFGVCKNCLK